MLSTVSPTTDSSGSLISSGDSIGQGPDDNYWNTGTCAGGNHCARRGFRVISLYPPGVDPLAKIIDEDVSAISLSPVFGILWRTVCNDRTNEAPRRDGEREKGFGYDLQGLD